jgi:RsiW-degrading membrane proteinase PrsW (M82 family)
MGLIITLFIAVIFGIVPMLIYAGFLWWLDRWEKEPLPLLGAAFLWGFIPSAIFALIAQIILDIPTTALFYYNEIAYSLVSASIIAPLTEESVKAFAVLLIFIFFYREFDSMLDGIIYGSLAGFGFAAIENILYFLSFGSDAGSLGCLIFMRAFLFGLNHAFFTSLTGLGFAFARYQKNILLKILFPLLGLAGAMFAHGLHNGLVTFGLIGLPFAVLADWFGVIGVFVVALVSLYHEAGWIKKHLAEEVQLGNMTAAQAAVAGSFGGRIGAGFSALSSGSVGKWWRSGRFYQQCAELAYKKHQLERMGEERGNTAIIERLRREVRALSTQV